MEQPLPEEDVLGHAALAKLIRTPVSDISTMSRNTQGVRLIRLDETETDRLVGISRVEAMSDETEASA